MTRTAAGKLPKAFGHTPNGEGRHAGRPSAHKVLNLAAELAADHLSGRYEAPVCGDWSEAELRVRLDRYDFKEERDVIEVASDLFDLLGRFAVRNDSPRYFGLFNPPPLLESIVGDLVTAVVNPQLAVWSHAPAAAEIERRMVGLFGKAIWDRGDIAGHFTSGGSEANYTALLSALARLHPTWASSGVVGLEQQPAIYASTESHLAWIKLARAAGLGDSAVRLVRPGDGLALRGEELRQAIDKDRGRQPCLIVGTAGTTAHGAIDDLHGLAEVAVETGSYFHIDAAWAGGSLLETSARALLSGIERADSVTIDPHKWLAVPMGAGLFLARSWDQLSEAFTVSTSYMPSADQARRDAYIHSMQWSRRFIGGKLFVALAALGLPGYADLIKRQFEIGRLLRELLLEQGWNVCNETPFPLVCFVPMGAGDREVREIELAVAASGAAWISSVKFKDRLVLRACVTSFETGEADVNVLIRQLAEARRNICTND